MSDKSKPRPKFLIKFHQIQCERPSTGINISAADAAKKAGKLAADIGKTASAVAGLAGPEAKAAAVTVQVAGTITAATASLVKAFDGKLRDRGLLPDDFYISMTSASDPTSGELRPEQVLWPKAGKNPKHHNVELASGDAVKDTPLSFDVEGGRAVVLWDWDRLNKDGPVQGKVTRDDVLFKFDVIDEHVGRHQNAYYNAIQDCSYYIDWELRRA